MNHFDSLSGAADTTLFMTRVDLPRAEEAIHAFLDAYSGFDVKQLTSVLAGDTRADLYDLETIQDCLDSSETKHIVKFGALAILTAIAWDYDPQAVNTDFSNRNSSAAMSVLTGVSYASHNRVANTAHAVAEDIGNIDRDSSTEDIQMALLTYRPPVITSYEDVDLATETSDDTGEVIRIDDEEMQQRVAAFPWVDASAADIMLEARLERGLNNIDTLIVDLSPYSSRMRPILADARASFGEDVFRSMELSQIAKVLTGDQSGYVQPPPFRDSNLPDTYCAKSFGSNHSLRRLYLARLGEYEGKPVFARLGFSRTKQNQSKLSQLLGYYPVTS